ncbi:MAG: N-acetylglucosaminyl-diphospho-decaprenol L-rhamnosyltransferase [Microgenomates bacterium OLB23]|nr:MAG: N-acetylglucosaminyl-diphospho-decaprenol L-rhamnosyltransferase [Microgenomates bacterium OLB23]
MRIEILQQFLQANTSVLRALDEVIVVTSALNSTALWNMRKKYDFVRYINITENKGFAHTVNIGMRVATGKYIGTCNDDTLLNANTFTMVNDAPANAGALNPIIKTSDGTVESAGIRVLPKGKAEPITTLPATSFTPVDATNGACVLYARDALEKTGLFDESFGSYLEDIDLSLRIKKAGFTNYVYKHANIVHEQHKTSVHMGSKKQWLDAINWWRIIIKNRHITPEVLFRTYPQPKRCYQEL